MTFDLNMIVTQYFRRARVEPRFETDTVNNTLVVARLGESIDLSCRIFMIQVFDLEIFIA